MMPTSYELNVLFLSIKVGIVAVFFSLPFGITIAWILARTQFWGKSLLNAFIHLPLVLPPVALGYLLLRIMGKQGTVGHFLYHFFGISFSFNWAGAALASAVVAFPLLVRSIRLAIDAVDIRLEQVARTLGAHPIRIFFTVTLPLTLPGIITGFILAFARSLGEFGATITFVSNIPNETRTLPLALYTLIEGSGHETETIRLCVISITLSLVALLISEMCIHWHKKRIVS